MYMKNLKVFIDKSVCLVVVGGVFLFFFFCLVCFCFFLFSLKKCVLCLGETGIGKSTMMDTLFNTSFEATASTHDLPNVDLKAHSYGRWKECLHTCIVTLNNLQGDINNNIKK